MSSALAALPWNLGRFALTKHAEARMASRAIPRSAIEATLQFGRCVQVRGAHVFAIGRKEVKKYRRDGIDLYDLEGTQVVTTDDGAVMTVYRNSDFRSLRTRRSRKFRK